MLVCDENEDAPHATPTIRFMTMGDVDDFMMRGAIKETRTCILQVCPQPACARDQNTKPQTPNPKHRTLHAMTSILNLMLTTSRP